MQTAQMQWLLGSGFYSHGELAPSSRGASCRRHSQTMTLVTLAKV